MRRGGGISALSRHTATTSSYATLSTSITASQLASLTSSLAGFREQLVLFASQHRADIRKDPAFRHQFQKMCAAIGVDPLAGPALAPGSSGSGVGGGKGGKIGAFWTDLLGLGEWQFELAVQVVDVCVSTRERNGGMIEMGELIRKVERLRSGGIRTDGGGPSQSSASKGKITPEDILRSLDLLKPLHAGYTTHSIGGTTFVRSVPRELDTDQSVILVLAKDAGGRLTESGVKEKTGWSDVRSRTVLDDCVMREGLGWVDDQAGLGEKVVWIIAAADFKEDAVI